jgi:hypothetical protein
MTDNYLSRLKNGNIGVALGDVSGGLCAIDCDTDSIAQDFTTSNPPLKATLQTHGARGRVFWLRFDQDYPRRSSKLKTQAGEVGEFRTNGNQSIVWGTHPEGMRYRFLVKQPAARLEFASLKWPPTLLKPPLYREDRVTDVISVSLSLCLSVKSVSEAVALCIPDIPHLNNSALFRLARALKALEKTAAHFSKKDRMDAFDQWYAEAHKRGVLRAEQNRDQYLLEFMHALKQAKYPLGEGPAELAWKRAQSEPLPPEAAVFESAECKSLVGFCYQLHLLSKGKPWFLAARTAAALTGRSHTLIATWLSALVEMEVLRVVEPHTATKATRYQYAAEGAKQ